MKTKSPFLTLRELRSATTLSLVVLIFLALIQPFGIDQIKEGRVLFILSETALTFVSVLLSIQIVRLLIHGSADEEASTRRLVYRDTLVFLINAPILSAFLLTFCSWWNTGDALLFWHNEQGHVTLSPFWYMLIQVACISVIIGIVDIYRSRNDSLQRRLREVEKINALLEQHQEELSEQEDEEDTSSTPKISEPPVVFIGQGQNARLEVPPGNIIYVESMANYADICYIAGEAQHHTTLRITLKQVRELLKDVDAIVQCHRAFLVNINFVLKMTDRGTNGYQLQLFGLEKQIPVSRANTDLIKNKLEHH